MTLRAYLTMSRILSAFGGIAELLDFHFGLILVFGGVLLVLAGKVVRLSSPVIPLFCWVQEVNIAGTSLLSQVDILYSSYFCQGPLVGHNDSGATTDSSMQPQEILLIPNKKALPLQL